MLDGHIHIGKPENNKTEFLNSLHTAGFEGGLIISPVPASFQHVVSPKDWIDRLDYVVEYCKGDDSLFPFLWIDPTEDDIEEQIATASPRVDGFKIICNKFFPSDERAMKAYHLVSSLGKPILFHSGILWDDGASARYNRPGEFECMLEIPNLRFAMAHVSWPWCDECLAVYGKFRNARASRPDITAQMFIDMTPGTPPIYRNEVLTKLFTVGYDIENNVIFGSDCTAESYSASYASEWVTRDKEIYANLEIAEDVITNIFETNLLRFIGKKE